MDVDYISNQLDFILKLPEKGYHAYEGKVEVFNEKNLSFECGCGSTHLVRESFAIIDFGLVNKAVYVCPKNKTTMNLVKVTGFFSIKGLKNIHHLTPKTDEQAQDILTVLESRKKID